MNNQQTNQLLTAGVGLDVNINLSALSAVYLVAVILFGSLAYFACKKYIR